MSQDDNFLHTTHRTISWFRKALLSEDLILSPPFQRNAVWTNVQKSYLLDTVLSALPIPEIYMQDAVNEAGDEKHIVVDGQQRIRSVLEFVKGDLKLEGEDVTRKWRGLKFQDLGAEEKKAVFNYKFVARILPPKLGDNDIRAIFARLNKNVVSLTDQELRNATYWGHFIKTIQSIGDDDVFWSESGLFSANDHRRMADHEFISELAIAYLHGPQNKKDRIDQYYQMYEETFDDREDLVKTFRATTQEISRIFPTMRGTRWKKKSDFYTLFLELAARSDELPYDASRIVHIRERLKVFGEQVDRLLRIEGEAEGSDFDKNVIAYAQYVSRAASDRVSRIVRSAALSRYVYDEESINAVAASASAQQTNGTVHEGGYETDYEQDDNLD